jgi:hypothetical protein
VDESKAKTSVDNVDEADPRTLGLLYESVDDPVDPARWSDCPRLRFRMSSPARRRALDQRRFMIDALSRATVAGDNGLLLGGDTAAGRDQLKQFSATPPPPPAEVATISPDGKVVEEDGKPVGLDR